MRQIINFFLRNYIFFLFLLFEAVTLVLTINKSKNKTEKFLTSANAVSGFYYNQMASVSDYFNLRDQNEKLKLENLYLKKKLSAYTIYTANDNQIISEQQFSYSLASVVKNSVNRKQNYITLNKGSKHGIKKNSAVISSRGVIGITGNVGRSYTSVISLLNTQLKITGKLKKNSYFGTISWDGNDPGFVNLTELPGYINVAEGDTVVTSGYSAIFPESVPIGVVSEIFRVKRNGFYRLKLKLLTDFRKLEYVYIVENRERLTLDSLDNKTEQDFHFFE
ncbi:MAG: rod shape-determining protein MreC [Bacteroidota bacterium]|nr:rod shape-determining protein MreC [Bacteroidota bacterium]